MFTRNNRWVYALGACVAVAQSNTAFAQLEEIVVTAQRREQNIQDVPISISALSSDDMAAFAVTGMKDLGTVAPGLSITRSRGAMLPILRGIGTNGGQAGNESSVAMYVDGIYHSNLMGMNVSFNNVERIEVLKGPQGTLFGRNATGGLVNIITKKPSADAQAALSLNYGNFDTFDGNFYGTTGVTDTIAVDLALYGYDRGEGWGTNTVTGNDSYRREEHSARASVLFTPSEATEVRLVLDEVRAKSSQGSDSHAVPGTRYIDGVPAEPGDADYFDTRNSIDQIDDIRQYGASLRIQHDFSTIRVVSQTAYRDIRALGFLDQDKSPLGLVTAHLDDYTDTFSQELQVLSGEKSAFEWIGGLYYFRSSQDYDPVSFAGSAFAALGSMVSRYTQQDTDAIAVYGQSTFDVWQGGHLTLGLRQNWEERKFDAREVRANGQVITRTADSDKSFSELTWRLALDQQLTDGVLAFVSYNRGFKAGLFNNITINDPPADAEILDAYEIGLKSELLDNRLVLNVGVFYYDYQDLQVQAVQAGQTLLQNAAQADIRGAEIELQASPLRNLQLRLGVSYLDTEFTSFSGAQITTPRPAPGGGNIIAFGSVKGNELPRSPQYTANVGVRYDILTAQGNLEFSGSYYYNDGFYWQPENRTRQDSYGLVNAVVRWSSPSDKFGVRLFGQNLTNEKYSSFTTTDSFGDHISGGAPREYGIGFDIKFD